MNPGSGKGDLLDFAEGFILMAPEEYAELPPYSVEK
jgi:hypothetical protein